MEGIPIIYSKDVNTGTIQQIKSVGNVLLSTNGGLDNLTDVSLNTPTNNELLKYNGTTWVNGSTALSTLSDVSLTSPATNNFLRYNGTNWVNTARDYIVINMYGTSATGAYNITPNNPKPIMAGISTYWQAPIPNPVTNTNGNMASSISPLSSVFDSTTGFITLNSTKRYMITATKNEGGIAYDYSTLSELSIYNASSGTPVAFSPNFVNYGRIDIDFTGMGVTTNAVVYDVSKIAVMYRLVTTQAIGVNATDTSISVSVLEI